jgi:hypothetical protein
MTTFEHRLDRSTVSADVIEKDVAAIWDELKGDAAVRAEAAAAGIDLGKIDAIKNNPIDVKQAGQGLDPATTAIIVASAPVVAEICRDIWRHIILPRLKRKYGQDAIR